MRGNGYEEMARRKVRAPKSGVAVNGRPLKDEDKSHRDEFSATIRKTS